MVFLDTLLLTGSSSKAEGQTRASYYKLQPLIAGPFEVIYVYPLTVEIDEDLVPSKM